MEERHELEKAKNELLEHEFEISRGPFPGVTASSMDVLPVLSAFAYPWI